MHHLREKKGAILTCDVSKTHVPKEVRKIHRFSMGEIHKTMKKTKVFLMGCGSLFQDATSFRSFIYYYIVLRMAFLNRCKTMLYANGIGPITRKSNLRRMKYLIKRVDCITVRDQRSYDFLKALGGRDNIFLTADDSFSHPLQDLKPIKPPSRAEGRRIVGLNLRIETDISPEKLSDLADSLFTLAEKHQLFYYFIPFHFEQDLKMLKKLSEMLPNVATFIEDASTPSQLLPYIAAAEFQIYERLHGQILSTILEIPYLPINYDIKIAGYARQVGIEDYLLDHHKLDKEHLIRAAERVMEDRELLCKKLSAYTDAAKKKVQLNRENLLKLIEEN